MKKLADFQLFGFGPRRRKILYQAGRVTDALTSEELASFRVHEEKLNRADYAVELQTSTGRVTIAEDEEGVFIERAGEREWLTRSSGVRLPKFEGHSRAALLRILHGELLVNFMPWGPVPNLWTYERAWYRDAAMVLLALELTENLGMAEAWVDGLVHPFDRNNAGNAEPDNLGQVLTMLGLLGANSHPLRDRVLKAAEGITRDGHLVGLSDFAEHPVYQTKWLKYGLAKLGLDDGYSIPAVVDTYSALFWMAYRDEHVLAPRFSPDTAKRYPYLSWAEAHFFLEPPPHLASPAPAITTWEAHASEARYAGLISADPALIPLKVATPHTWHAAEMFLYYTDPATSQLY